MARMRYPQQALELIREEDPNTSLTLNFIRELAYSGKIPCIKIGRRHLINVDALIEYLESPDKHKETSQTGVIRRIRA